MSSILSPYIFPVNTHHFSQFRLWEKVLYLQSSSHDHTGHSYPFGLPDSSHYSYIILNSALKGNLSSLTLTRQSPKHHVTVTVYNTHCSLIYSRHYALILSTAFRFLFSPCYFCPGQNTRAYWAQSLFCTLPGSVLTKLPFLPFVFAMTCL